MRPVHFLTTLLVILGIFSTSTHEVVAQGDGDAQSKRAMARFTVWGNWDGQELFIKPPNASGRKEEEYVKIDLLDLGYSAEIAFLKERPIELCTPLQKEGETTWQTLMAISIPAEIRQPLVMILPRAPAGPRYKIYELDPAVFPYGSYQIVNLTDARLFAKLDDNGMLLTPGTHANFKGTGQTSLNVWLRVAAEKPDKDARVVYSSMMKNRNDKRMFMFFAAAAPGPDAEVSVRTLVDFSPSPKGP